MLLGQTIGCVREVSWTINMRLIGGVAGLFSGWGGGRHGHLKAITRPRRAFGGEGPPDGREVSFFKRCKVLENDSSFQKYQHFSCPKNLFFSKKKFEKVKIFDRNLRICSNNYFKFSPFMKPYKFREILCEFKYLNEKFMKKAHKIA